MEKPVKVCGDQGVRSLQSIIDMMDGFRFLVV